MKYGVCENLATEIAWHAIAGKRAALFQKFVSDKVKQTLLTLLLIVLEPLRYLTRWLMKASSSASRAGNVEHPPLCTWVHPRVSPLRTVRRYFALLLRGRAKRLSLVFLRAGCKDIASWTKAFRAEATVLRRLILAADSWVVLRHLSEATSYPWRLANAVDNRLSDEERWHAAWHFHQARSCCLDEYFGRRLQRRLNELDLGTQSTNVPPYTALSDWVSQRFQEWRLPKLLN